MTFDRSAWSDDIKQQVVLVGKQFTEPDEDWMPMMFVVTDDGDGKVGLALGAIDPRCFANEETKDALAYSLPGILAEMKATAYGLLLSCYGIRQELDPATTEDEAREQVGDFLDEHDSLSAHPDAEELLVLMVSDTEGTNVYAARVLRDGEQPPVLGEWEDWSKHRFEGRFAGALGNGRAAYWAEHHG